MTAPALIPRLGPGAWLLLNNQNTILSHLMGVSASAQNQPGAVGLGIAPSTPTSARKAKYAASCKDPRTSLWFSGRDGGSTYSALFG